MKAKDLTQDDVGKWVTLPLIMQVDRLDSDDDDQPVKLVYDEKTFYWPNANAIVEFCEPPQQVGDVFKNIGNNPAEWTLSMIDGDACIMRYLTGHVSADYPLNPALWEFVRKGNAA